MENDTTLELLENRYGLRFEQGGNGYVFQVQLLKEGEDFDQIIVLPRFKYLVKEWAQWEGGQMWETVEHIFEDYPAGIRKIGIQTSGKDSQFWAGYYGPKFTNTEIFITMPDEPVWRKKDDVKEPEKMVSDELGQVFDYFGFGDRGRRHL